MIDYIGRTIHFFSLKWLLTFGFLGHCYLIKLKGEGTHRKVSFTEQKFDLKIFYHKRERSGCFFMTLLSAYQVNHTRREQNEPMKRSLNFLCGNEYFKHLSTVKLIWNFPIRPERKIILRQKNFGPYFFSLNCVSFSRSAVML